ncbi:PH domain-containing protein [Brachyspira intermedia]|uniref:PH domain-containing protein n=1 Tax=Brachyspira intermedia TaxID=84377 RepID=UPI00262C811E|nr:PH domain-containing protein [uncultured Brachyspira sp.]
MFCQNCGSENEDNVKFCSNCGNSINTYNTYFGNITSENNEFKHSSAFGRIKTQIDSIKDQPDTSLSDDNINQLSEIINDDENILYFTSGFSAFGNDSLLLILTSKRVIVAKWGIFKPIEEKKSIPLDSINKVSSSIGIMGAEITIDYGNNSEYITDIGKESGRLFEYKINRELEKYNKNEIQIKETEKVKEIQNHNFNNNINPIENKDRYLFFKNRYVNCSSIQEIKREENTILIMTSKNVYYFKYNSEERAIDNHNKLISFITNEVFDLEDDEEK